MHGEPKWYPISIVRMLQNEKYKGDLLLQKTYTTDFLIKEQIENDGKVNQYYIENDHEPIIDKDEWEAVQLDLAQREAFKRKHGIRELGSSTLNPFTAKVYCSKCGGKYMRKNWKGIRSVFWKCENADKKRGKTCAEPNIPEERLRNAIVVAWNSIVENRNNYFPGWETAIKTGDPLQRLRAKQMIELIAEGPLEIEIPELTRMVLSEIRIVGLNVIRVEFKDGTVVNTCI